MASIQPVAAAQYYWNYHFSPPKAKLFLTWIQGWTTWIGYIALVARFLNGNSFIIEDLIQMNHPEYEPSGYKTTLIMLATLAPCVLVNMYAFRLGPWFELSTSLLNIVLIVVFLVVLCVMAPGNDARIFLATNTSSTTLFRLILAPSLTYFSGTIGIISLVSRLTWAWARDGGLPQYFGYVDGKYGVPIRSVLLTATIVTALSLLNLGSGTYVAFTAIVSLSSLGPYVSYAVVLACIIYARFTPSGIELGEWNWGKAEPIINIVAVMYTVWVAIFLPFPNYLPVDASNMNHSGPVYGFVLRFALSYWFLGARKHWKGPNRAVIDIVFNERFRALPVPI